MDETAAQKARFEAVKAYTEKIGIKVDTTRQFGQKIDQRISVIKAEREQALGAIEGLKQALSSTWGSVADSVKKDVEDGLLNDMPSSPLELSEIVMRYLKKVHGGLDNLRERFAAVKIQSDGKVHELTKLLDTAKEMCDAEHSKLKNFQSALENGDIQFDVLEYDDGAVEAIPVFNGEGERPSGIRPGMSAAEDLQRRREAAKKAKEVCSQKEPLET